MPLAPLTAIVTVRVCAVVMLDKDGVTVTVGVARLTTWLNAVALLVIKALPMVGEYTAVMLRVPTANVLVM